jgi:hypothetical protein
MLDRVLIVTPEMLTAAKKAATAGYDTLAASRDQFVAMLAEAIVIQSEPAAPTCDHPQGYRHGGADSTGRITQWCGMCGVKLVDIDLKVKPVEAVARNAAERPAGESKCESTFCVCHGCGDMRMSGEPCHGGCAKPAQPPATVKLPRLESVQRWVPNFATQHIDKCGPGAWMDGNEAIEAARLDLAAAQEQDRNRNDARYKALADSMRAQGEG